MLCRYLQTRHHQKKDYYSYKLYLLTYLSRTSGLWSILMHEHIQLYSEMQGHISCMYQGKIGIFTKKCTQTLQYFVHLKLMFRANFHHSFDVLLLLFFCFFSNLQMILEKDNAKKAKLNAASGSSDSAEKCVKVQASSTSPKRLTLKITSNQPDVVQSQVIDYSKNSLFSKSAFFSFQKRCNGRKIIRNIFS